MFLVRHERFLPDSRTIDVPERAPLTGVVARLAPARRLEGRVRGPDGDAPPAGTVVRWVPGNAAALYGGDIDNAWLFASFVATGPGGAFSIPLPADGRSLLLRASAAGFTQHADERVLVPSGGTPELVELSLEPAHTLTLRVSGADDRAPLAGALVEQRGRPGMMERRIVLGTTDAAGEYRVEGLRDGPVSLRISAPGRLREDIDVKVSGSLTFEVRLQPATILAGIVRDTAGEPIANGLVSANQPAEDGVPGSWSDFTDDAGRFRIEGVPVAGMLRVFAQGDAARDRDVRPAAVLDIQPGSEDLVIELERGLSIRGRVVDPDGRGVLWARVRAIPAVGDRPAAVHADADGRFAVRGLQAGPVVLEIVPRRQISPDVGVEVGHLMDARVEGVAAGAQDVEVQLVTGASIEGTVSTAAGAGVAGLWLRAEPLGDVEGARRTPPGAMARDDGTFRIAGLIDGSYRLVGVRSNWPESPEVLALAGGERVVAGSKAVRLVLDEGGLIAGRLLDAAGAPVVGAAVRAIGADGLVRFAEPTDEGGAFLVSGLASGAAYTLNARLPGSYLPTSQEDVRAGATGVELQLDPGRGLTALVRAADGKPLVETRIRLTPVDGGIRDSLETTTDAEGRFEIAGLREVAYRIEELLPRWIDGRMTRPLGQVSSTATSVELTGEDTTQDER
jgi:hypothetical protein